MKAILLLLSIAAALHASPACLPNTALDSQPVPQSCYGGQVFAIPDSQWIAWFNDNLPASPANDWDANDGVLGIQFDATGSQATVTLLAGLSAHLDTFWVGPQFLFSNMHPVGTQATVATIPWIMLALSGTDTVTMQSYAAVAGNLNWITDGPRGGSAVPEPGTVGLFGAGLLAMLARKRRA